MKKQLITGLLLVLFTAGGAFAQKFGHINSQELLMEMPERDTAEKKMEQYAKDLESQLQLMSLEYESKVSEYKKNEVNMTDFIRNTKIKEITDLEARIRDFQSTAQDDLADQEQKLLQPMLDRAKKAIKEVADENKYTYIFDTSGGSILHFPDGDNILPLVKKKLEIQ